MSLPFAPDVLEVRPDGGQLIVGCTQHHGEIWAGALVFCSIDADVNSQNCVDTYTGVSGCAYVESESSSMSVVSTHDDGGVHLWDANGTHTASFVGHTDAALCVAAAPTRQQVMTGGMEGTVRMWDVEAPDAVAGNFKGHSGRIHSLVWGKSRVASGGADGTVRLWDPREREATCAMPIADGNAEVLALSWSASANLLAVGSEFSNALVFDVRNTSAPLSGKPTLNQHAASVTSVAFSPHVDHLLASGSDDAKICVANESSMLSGSAHNDSVTAVAWHPTLPSTLLSAAWDSCILTWSVEFDGDCPIAISSSNLLRA